MATADPIPDLTRPPERSSYALLVLLAPLPHDQLDQILEKLATLFPPEELIVAVQAGLPAETHPTIRVVEAPQNASTWTLTASDFVNAYELAKKYEARSILILGPESGSLSSAALRELSGAVLAGSVDLAVPYYHLPPHAGLVNSAILYPVTRTLFATPTRYPLAIDLGLSLRMAERLSAAAQKFVALNQSDALIWPVPEAIIAGFNVQQFDAGSRALPQPPDPDIRTILGQIAGSLFADVEAKAAYWQRPRRLVPSRFVAPPLTPSETGPDVVSMVEGYKLAYSNLQEIWSLVLPPQSLGELKRLSSLDPARFRMPDNLWARIIFDFLIAFRLRTINRGHLLGALIPLYLAWVASHINVTTSGVEPERHVEAVAAAFDADKAYLVARWRWPDRFNP